MILAVPREASPAERRVALVPDTVGRLVKSGIDVRVARGAGTKASFPDEAYAAAGATLIDDSPASYAGADAVITVGRPADALLACAVKPGTVVVGFFNPLGDPGYVRESLKGTGVTALAMEMIPRITRAQSMDALSSQSNIAGYKAVLLGAATLPVVLSDADHRRGNHSAGESADHRRRRRRVASHRDGTPPGSRHERI